MPLHVAGPKIPIRISWPPQGPLPVVLASVKVSFFGLHSGHTHISPSLSPGPQHYATNDVKTRFASFRFIASPTDSVSFFLLSRHASSSCCCCCCCTTVVAFLNASHSFIENGQQSNNNSNNSNNNAISFIFAQKSSQKANVKINKAKSKEIKFQIRAATSNQQKQQRRKLSKSSSSAAKKSKIAPLYVIVWCKFDNNSVQLKKFISYIYIYAFGLL